MRSSAKHEDTLWEATLPGAHSHPTFSLGVFSPGPPPLHLCMTVNPPVLDTAPGPGSGYLTKLLQNHTAYACDGDHLNLQCPRHSTISVQSAFYGQDFRMCSSQQPAPEREDSLACVAPTTLQKVLDECQNQRACHLLVNSRVFGPDLCPGSSKYLLVSFKCQPNELKNKTVCEDQELKLHCHESKFLNIYSATYGRRTQQRDACASEAGWLPPFDCLSHSALPVLSRRCYGKQRCKILVNNHHFGSPCLPGVKKYLTVTYACVPKSILSAIDPAVVNLRPSLEQEDGAHGVTFDPSESKILRKDGVIVSNSLAAFAYIRGKETEAQRGHTLPKGTWLRTPREPPCCSCPACASAWCSPCAPWSSSCPAPRTSGSCGWGGSTWCRAVTRRRTTARRAPRRSTPPTRISRGSWRRSVGLPIPSTAP
ncbi:protein eva-1 homolog C isoform X4 [Oryctolagus cuniculus]|uniref:protein eva-1 homolog C isoform X4 n=1 Tax=Oryctolagus cuniculus TaxID=9986 RepID=UPI0038791227